MGNSPFSKGGSKNSVLDELKISSENIRHRAASGNDTAEDDSRDKSDDTRPALHRKRDSFSYLKSTQEFQRKEKGKSNFITKDYLKKMQTHENPFQEIDIALGTPRVLKRYVYDEQKLGQGKFAEFSLETVRDENSTGKNDDKEDLMKVLLQHKMLHEEKSKQLSIPKNPENIKYFKEDKLLGNELLGSDGNSPEKRRVSILTGRPNENLVLKLEKSNESAGKSAKAFSKGVIKLESIAEKDEVRTTGIGWKQNQPIKHMNDESGIRTEFERNNTRHHSNVINKAPNVKKIFIESDDEDNINEMKEIEPLMILAHQNVKPTKYIFNTKYMGEKISESDKKFLAPKLPNLFKEPNKRSTNTNEENNMGESSKGKKANRSPKEEPEQAILNYSTINKFNTDQSQRFSIKETGSHKTKTLKTKI